MLSQAVFKASLVFARLARGFEALAAATTSRMQIRAGVAREWVDFNASREEVFSGLLIWERLLYDEVLWPFDRVLVIGCGTGRDLIALADRGHEVVGVDPSPEALGLARTFCAERHVPADFVEGFFEDVGLEGPFDAIVFSHRCYGLIPGSAHRIAALRKARRLLTASGRIVISYATGVALKPALITVMNAVGRMVRSDFRVESGDDVYRIAESRPFFGYEHKFTKDEIVREAREAGLVVGYVPETWAAAVFVDATAASSVQPAITVAKAAASGAP